ncbi:MAG: ABC transporter permease [Pseudomonadota bacterium]
MKKFKLFNFFSLLFGLGFLYLPIAILIVYSFNDSRLVTVWGGFSTRWYTALFQNEQMLDAAWITFQVGVLSASIATLMGILIAVVLARYRFRGKALFFAFAFAPLVLPEVIMGLSLLLLFVALDIQRGFFTVILAHASFSAAFAAVIIHAQLINFDRNLEEAALNLGCPPWKTFLQITLPLIAPSVAAAWLLSFTLSLDDLVIASFTTGPGATTLPMRIYSQMRLGVSPEINALSTLLIALVACVALTAALLSKRRLIVRAKT